MPKTGLYCLVEKWPSAIVARSEVGRFSGGLLHPRTLANIDSRGEGPPKITVGRKVAYKTTDLVVWLERRMRESGNAVDSMPLEAL